MEFFNIDKVLKPVNCRRSLPGSLESTLDHIHTPSQAIYTGNRIESRSVKE